MRSVLAVDDPAPLHIDGLAAIFWQFEASILQSSAQPFTWAVRAWRAR